MDFHCFCIQFAK